MSLVFQLTFLLILILVRFSYDIPVVFLDDSVKYFVPQKYLNSPYTLPYIFEGLNFSLFNKMISAFFQSIFDGSLKELIAFQKALGILSTIIFYFTLKDRFKVSEEITSVASILFSLNPFMLYIEQAIMPESYFIFFSILSIYFLTKLLDANDNFKTKLYSLTFGLCLSVLCIIKETAFYWSVLVIIVLCVIFIRRYLNDQNYNHLALVLILIISSQAFSLPSRVYHLSKYDKPVISLASTKGVILYTISLEMLEKPCSKNFQMIQVLLKEIRKANLKKFKALSNKLNEEDMELAYSGAISQLNVAGREGRLINPVTKKNISSHKWAELCMGYAIEKALQSPDLFLKRIIKISFPNLFFNKNYTLQYTRKSSRPGLNLEVMQFIPHTFLRFEPVLGKAKQIQAQQIDQILSTDEKIRPLVFMFSRGTDKAFSLEIKSFSLWWQETAKDFGYAKILLPIFLILAITFFIKEGFKAKHLGLIFCIASSLYFMIFPLLISMCEARYRLQFEHFLLISIAVLLQYCKTHLWSKNM